MQDGDSNADIYSVISARRLATLSLALASVFAWTASPAAADARGDCSGSDASHTGSNLAALRTTVICLTNRERVARGMGALTEESHLTAAAQGHSEDMAQNNYFDHTNLAGKQPWDRTKDAGYSNGWVGENIAAGYQTPFVVMTGWMKSSGHCSNILNSRYSDIGIGVAKKSGSRYGTYWTMVLGGNNGAARVTVACPYNELYPGAIAVEPPVIAPAPGVSTKVIAIKRRADGRYRVTGTVTPAAKGTLVKLKVRRGKKVRRYSVRTDAAGSFKKTVRAPKGSGKLRVTAKASA